MHGAQRAASDTPFQRSASGPTGDATRRPSSQRASVGSVAACSSFGTLTSTSNCQRPTSIGSGAVQWPGGGATRSQMPNTISAGPHSSASMPTASHDSTRVMA